MNSLSQERSAYLKHAASQKIDWYPWSENAFEIAREGDKPVFLSSGAVWCHWCHVMAKECFYDEEISELLNRNFINIKLDRDERPDIDRRYQMAVAAMGQGGGWPLSVFLTPDKAPFFGGTYFPPEDKLGRPGFKKVLKAVHDLYQSKKDEISEYTDNLMNAIKTAPMPHGEIRESQINDAVKRILSQFDSQNGGFGSAPKFPMPGAIEFLINRYFLTGDKAIGSAVRKTLNSMARGGFYDQLGGGFHRYSTDESWIIPHFEKMADDNAWLLKNYLSAYAVFGDDFYREIAEGIINFVRTVLSNPGGGFYTSQDADVTPDDEGGYFTWSEEDFKNILNGEEHRIMSLYLLHKAGSMHHDQSKKVLFLIMGASEIAEKTGKDESEVLKTIQSGKEKLLGERNKREIPFIDTTLYTSINGMFISTYLHGYRILKDNHLKDVAIKSLEKIVKTQFINKELYHTENVRALLDDYVYLIDALVAAYEVTGSASYIAQAEELMEMCVDTLWDKDEGGFFDTDDHLLGVSIKGIEEIPHPSANSLSIRLLLKIFSITGKEVYRQYAEQALRVFTARAGEAGIHAGYYFNSLDAYFNPLKLTLHARPESVLSDTAISLYSPYTDIQYDKDMGRIVPCLRDVCSEPVRTPDELKDFINKRKSTSNDPGK